MGLGFLGRIFVWWHRKFFVCDDTAVIIPTPSWVRALQAGVSFYKYTLHSFCPMPLYIPHTQPIKWSPLSWVSLLPAQCNTPLENILHRFEPSPHIWIITCCPYLYTRHKTIMPGPRQESAHHKLKEKTLQWNKITHMLYNNTPFFYFLKDHSLNNYFNEFYFLLSSTQQAR